MFVFFSELLFKVGFNFLCLILVHLFRHIYMHTLKNESVPAAFVYLNGSVKREMVTAHPFILRSNDSQLYLLPR